MIPTAILILIFVAVLGVSQTPDAMKWCSARLIARAEALTKARLIYKEAVASWEREFGLEHRGSAARSDWIQATEDFRIEEPRRP